MRYLSWSDPDRNLGSEGQPVHFGALRRQRYVASVREVIDAEGLQVISNEVYHCDREAGTVSGAPLRSGTLEELVEHGFEPSSLRADMAWR